MTDPNKVLTPAQIEYMFASAAKREAVAKLEAAKANIGMLHSKLIVAQRALTTAEITEVHALMQEKYTHG